jgi:hypothetical protein
VRCREITAEDFGAVAKLLCEGFPRRSEKYWRDGLQHLESLPVCKGFTKFGYKLEDKNDLVGVLLVLTSPATAEGEMPRRNVSSWYVKPQYRLYGTLLSHFATAQPANYIDIDPDPSTWDTIEVLGFQRFSKGTTICFPALNLRSQKSKIISYNAIGYVGSDLSSTETRILQEHYNFGCICLYCRTEFGTFPFVFRKRRLRRYLSPCAELIYCRDMDIFVKLAGSLGRYLASKGIFWVLLGANGSVDGLFGYYFPGKLPMYFKGQLTPRLGDLTYTEVAIFGA